MIIFLSPISAKTSISYLVMNVPRFVLKPAVLNMCSIAFSSESPPRADEEMSGC